MLYPEHQIRQSSGTSVFGGLQQSVERDVHEEDDQRNHRADQSRTEHPEGDRDPLPSDKQHENECDEEEAVDRAADRDRGPTPGLDEDPLHQHLSLIHI